jgi:hypothetical protein
MTRVVVDDVMRARLGGLTDQVELCDESGRVLGHFIPREGVPGLPAGADGCPYTAEELRRFQQETGGRPLAEIWKDLGRA